MGIRILIVDDERSIADTLVLILGHKGHIAQAAYDGAEALQIARVLNPHALISDVMMPGMNGVELARLIADDYPHCRVLLMTGHFDAAGLAEGLVQQGQQVDVLRKPVRPEEILEFVSSCTQVA